MPMSTVGSAPIQIHTQQSRASRKFTEYNCYGDMTPVNIV
jgi:hypothetical protein